MYHLCSPVVSTVDNRLSSFTFSFHPPLLARLDSEQVDKELLAGSFSSVLEILIYTFKTDNVSEHGIRNTYGLRLFDSTSAHRTASS